MNGTSLSIFLIEIFLFKILQISESDCQIPGQINKIQEIRPVGIPLENTEVLQHIGKERAVSCRNCGINKIPRFSLR